MQHAPAWYKDGVGHEDANRMVGSHNLLEQSLFKVQGYGLCRWWRGCQDGYRAPPEWSSMHMKDRLLSGKGVVVKQIEHVYPTWDMSVTGVQVCFNQCNVRDTHAQCMDWFG